jgi:hypothetical protein
VTHGGRGGGNRDYAVPALLRCSIIGLLQKSNTEFFSLELCVAMAIIRGAMAGNKTDIYGHVQDPAVTPSGSNVSIVSTTTILGEQ